MIRLCPFVFLSSYRQKIKILYVQNNYIKKGGFILNSNLTGQIILQAVLIAMNAIFACAEIAVISMSGNRLDKLAGDGDKRALRLARLTKPAGTLFGHDTSRYNTFRIFRKRLCRRQLFRYACKRNNEVKPACFRKNTRYYFGSIDYNNIIIFHTWCLANLFPNVWQCENLKV